MPELTFNPSEPNQDKTITIHFTSDEEGNMTIEFSSEGFEDFPEAVPAYLGAALKVAATAGPHAR